MSALLIIAMCVAYILIGGFAFVTIGRAFGGQRCDMRHHDTCGHAWLSGISIPFWPVIVPVLLGVCLGKKTGNSRIETKREHELERARHETAMAEERAKQAAALDRELYFVRK